jgi:hypothetical protein
MPYRSRVTVWPSPSVPYGLGFLVSNFRVRPDQCREEVQLYSVYWWRAPLIRVEFSATDNAVDTRSQS